MKVDQITTQKAPRAVSSYSQGLVVSREGVEVITSGQVAFDPTTGKIVEGGITEQTSRVLENIDAILTAGGIERGKKGMIISTNVLLANASDFAVFNEIYSNWIGEQNPPPTRFTSIGEIPVSGALIEISCRAIL